MTDVHTDRLRLMVVDDQTLIREALAGLLDAEPDMTVVAQASDGNTVVATAERTLPDLVVMDIRMRDVDGVEATIRLRERMPGTKVILLTTFDVDAYVYEGLRAGAGGFLLKDSSAAMLVDAVRTVAAGSAVLDPWATTRLVSAFARSPGPMRVDAPALARLTARERDVLILVAQGLSNNEIAAALEVGYETVKSHVGAMMSKLGLRDRVQAVIFAYESGLLTPSDSP
jgi:DNA-binding NarL/FixJ family response regulator